MLNNTPTTRGRVIAASARSGGRALKQERVPELGSGDVSVVRTSHKRVLATAARTP